MASEQLRWSRITKGSNNLGKGGVLIPSIIFYIAPDMGRFQKITHPEHLFWTHRAPHLWIRSCTAMSDVRWDIPHLYSWIVFCIPRYMVPTEIKHVKSNDQLWILLFMLRSKFSLAISTSDHCFHVRHRLMSKKHTWIAMHPWACLVAWALFGDP
jgi:hypothetical protein